MSLEGYDTLNPRVHFKILQAPAGMTAAQLALRLMKFEYIDEPRKRPHAIMDFDNTDGRIVNVAVLLLGLKVRVTFGYDGLRSRAFDVVIRKIKGGMVRSPQTRSPAPNATGVVQMEGVVHNTKLHWRTEGDIGVWRNTTMSKVVAQIARSAGYKEDKIFVEYDVDAHGQRERNIDEISISEDDTLEHFLRDAAHERGFVTYRRNGEFHWHSPGWKGAHTEEIEYFKGPDLLDFAVEGDYRINMSKVQGRAHNARLRRVFTYDAENNRFGVARPSLAEALARPSVNPTDVVAAISDKAKERAGARLAVQIRNRWKLNLTLVGNPKVLRGVSLQLGNFGPFIDGRWYCRGCRHIFDTSGYTTKMSLRAKTTGGGGGQRRFKFTVDPETGKFGVAVSYYGSLKKKKKSKRKNKSKLGPNTFSASSRRRTRK